MVKLHSIRMLLYPSYQNGSTFTSRLKECSYNKKMQITVFLQGNVQAEPCFHKLGKEEQSCSINVLKQRNSATKEYCPRREIAARNNLPSKLRTWTRDIAMATENLPYRSAGFLHLTQQPKIAKTKKPKVILTSSALRWSNCLKIIFSWGISCKNTHQSGVGNMLIYCSLPPPIHYFLRSRFSIFITVSAVLSCSVAAVLGGELSHESQLMGYSRQHRDGNSRP